MTITIDLGRGYTTFIDDEDADLAVENWRAIKCGHHPDYVTACRQNHKAGKNTVTYLHRVILGRKLGRALHAKEYTDHINGNPLDNRRGNLRLATVSQNQANRGKRIDNTSGFKGVFKNGKGWRAQICVNRKPICLGTRDTAEAAYELYVAAQQRYFGEFANTGQEAEHEEA